MPSSQMIIFRAYEVPELRHPSRNASIGLYPKVNSSVNALTPQRNTPTQKPMHIGHEKK
jgi:hypothetical protein